jgi:hypothetical protein
VVAADKAEALQPDKLEPDKLEPDKAEVLAVRVAVWAVQGAVRLAVRVAPGVRR